MESQLPTCEHCGSPTVRADRNTLMPVFICGSRSGSDYQTIECERRQKARWAADPEPELGVSLTDHTIERLIEQVNTTIGYLRGMSENGASFLPPHTRQGMIDRAENLCNAVDAVRGKR